MASFTVEITEKGSKSTFETTDVIEAVRKLETFAGRDARAVCLYKDGKEVLSYTVKPEPPMGAMVMEGMRLGAAPGKRGGPPSKGRGR